MNYTAVIGAVEKRDFDARFLFYEFIATHDYAAVLTFYINRSESK